MFWKRKAKKPPKPRSDSGPTGVYRQHTHEDEERTETLKLLLGSDFDGVALQDDIEPGSDPHDNTKRLSVKPLRSK